MRQSRFVHIWLGPSASLDVQKAFDSVSQESVLAICQVNGLAGQDLALLRNMYRDCLTRLKIEGTLSWKIWIKRMVKQGDPLSPILFNLVVYQLLRRLESLPIGLTLGGRLLTG